VVVKANVEATAKSLDYYIRITNHERCDCNILKFADCDRVAHMIATEIFLIGTDQSHANRPNDYTSCQLTAVT